MSGAKTDEPTTARIRQAREEGDTGASAYASRALALIVAVALVPATVAAVGARFEELLRAALAGAATKGVTDAALRVDAVYVAKDIALLSLPIVAGVALATATSAVVQAGGFGGTRRARGQRDRLAGVGAVVSGERVLAIVRTLIGGALIGWLVLHALRAHAADVVRTSGRLAVAGGVAARITRALGWQVALAGLGIAALDLVVTRALWRGRLRMSRDEVRRERRETEGDPHVRGERERARDERGAQGGAADVGRARVVVWDGEGAACALRYEEAEGDRAPVVLATTLGSGPAGDREMARAIVETARAAGVAVREDGVLARALVGAGAAGEAIPEALYDAVAAVLREIAPS